MTNMATVVLGGDASSEHLISISVVPISDKAATAIFVTDKGYVENKTFVIKNDKDGKDIIKCVDFLNKRLVGTSITDLSSKVESLKPILTDTLGKSSELIMEAFIEAFVKFAKDRLHTTGAQKLLELPEYGEDKKKLQNVLDLLDDPEKFEDLMESEVCDPETGTTFSQDDEDDVAVISQNFKIAGMPSAKVAVVGPQRMNYKKVIGALEYISEEISKYFSPEDESPSPKKGTDIPIAEPAEDSPSGAQKKKPKAKKGTA
jgi:heat-inducible transcriptional repressor